LLLFTLNQDTNGDHMKSPPEEHFRKTAKLAMQLKRPAVYRWLATVGYFPECYVLPPCFVVTSYPSFGKVYCPHTAKKFPPKTSEYLQIHFPKTELTDRAFGIIDPEIHSDIANTIARNWKALLKCIFHPKNQVVSYSFPIPLSSRRPGLVGPLRSGRLIYEFIEMAENDLAAISYRFRCIFKTDIKNFYPSIYTHSIPWAIHGKKFIRKPENRHSYKFFGNRLDKLFQYANDGCTNGVPIGPAVSDLIAEVVLSGVDRVLSKSLTDDVVVVRFKDDYRILAKEEEDGRTVIKNLQSALKEYRLELNDDKTECHAVPDGLFRSWVSQYHAANPRPTSSYRFKRFREVCLSVVRIDRDNPGCGVIDRFLADMITKKYKLRIGLHSRRLPQVLSLLLMLANLRTKAFPKVLAIIESALRSPFGKHHANDISDHLVRFLEPLCKRESENRYLIAWICYFLRANGLAGKLKAGGKWKFADPITKAVYTSRFTVFKACRDFKVFQGVMTAAKRISMLEHLDIFKR